MKENPLIKLTSLGQSIWLDYISRQMIDSGELQRLIDEDGLRGMTSNPAIFEKAIAGSRDYDDDIRSLAREGKSIQEIYEALTVADVQRAADVFRPRFEQLQGADGFVSLEVNPHLAHDTPGTIAEARRLVGQTGPAQRLHQGAGHPGGPAGHPAAHQRRDQRQRHPALRPAPLPGGGRGLPRAAWRSGPPRACT